MYHNDENHSACMLVAVIDGTPRGTYTTRTWDGREVEVRPQDVNAARAAGQQVTYTPSKDERKGWCR